MGTASGLAAPTPAKKTSHVGDSLPTTVANGDPIKVKALEISLSEREMVRRCLWNTMHTCVKLLARDDPEYPHGGTFVITGDIDDLWIRDSAAQVHPYLALVATNESVANMIEGLVRRQAFYINYEPYALRLPFRCPPSRGLDAEVSNRVAEPPNLRV